MSYGGDYDDDARAGIPSQTRTRLPEDPALPSRRPPASPRRSLMTIVGVVVLLIAAIVMANRADDRGGSSDNATDTPDGQAQPTAPTGEQPVDGSTNGIPSGFARTEQGAQSAAANYAVALVSAEILQPSQRPQLVQQVFTPERASEMHDRMAEVYSEEFLETLGLGPEGQAAEGMTYISRTVPIGTEIVSYSETTAEIDVWCTGLFGTAGEASTRPVTSDWFTMTLELRWLEGDWKVHSFTQRPGPAPVPGDLRASTADEIAEAIEEFGGFTYAR
ncbi:hypothetical protein GCM10009716_43140 [Streptomyces sodiiphilus]|uniref:DUF8175 domain-containing protein n=1 Tax=Streptomyces sodiiphilus TaxID=226217 RepID=A0ABN2PTY5_9ACTN